MLQELSGREVAEIVEACFGGSPMPYLTDPEARARAAETARRQGLVARIDAQLTEDRPIPVIPYTRFRDYRRNGNRTRCEKVMRDRGRQIELAAMACLLGRDALAYLHDLLWAECETTWWVMAAHETHGTPIDLQVAQRGCHYAVILTALRDRIEPEVRQRMLDEIQRRVLRPYLDAAHTHRWKAVRNNWNAVCLGGVAIAAMLIETEAPRLGRLIADALEHLPVFLSSFTEDGGCSEGPSYWRFGFGWYMRLAAALHDYTGGRIDIASGERIERICRYPLAANVAPGQELTFADAHPGYMPPGTAQLINRFHDVPELLGLCRLRDDGRPEIDALEDLLLYDGWTAEPAEVRADYFLPELGIAKVREGTLTVGAKAGHNAENHNHNDVGSFLVHRGRTFYLTDPGAPVYSRRTFSPQRYESVYCNSFGHSVPIIDGRPQPAGKEFCGTISVGVLSTDGTRTVQLELARAYDAAALEQLTRVIEVPPGGDQVRMTDTFAFARPPESLEEAFITTHAAEASDDGRSVTIRPAEAAPAVLSADGADGRFAVAELAGESAAESRSGEVIRRIAFTPADLAAEMSLRFVLRFE